MTLAPCLRPSARERRFREAGRLAPAGTLSTNVYALGYDRAGQLLDAVLRQAGPAGALVKRYAYAYDAAGNRTGEQAATDTRAGVHACTKPAAETANALNPLTARAGGGPCFRNRAGRTR